MIYTSDKRKFVVEAGMELTEEISKVIEESPIEAVEIRSVLTCESKQGICAKMLWS